MRATELRKLAIAYVLECNSKSTPRANYKEDVSVKVKLNNIIKTKSEQIADIISNSDISGIIDLTQREIFAKISSVILYDDGSYFVNSDRSKTFVNLSVVESISDKVDINLVIGRDDIDSEIYLYSTGGCVACVYKNDVETATPEQVNKFINEMKLDDVKHYFRFLM